MARAELIREMFAIIDDGKDWDRLDKIFAPDIVYFRPGYSTIRGIDELRTFYTATRRITVGRHCIVRVLSDGPGSCCWGMFSGKTKADEEVVVYFTDWYRFADDLITYRRTFFYQPTI
jgi:ketosteroid isomerase-like protein